MKITIITPVIIGLIFIASCDQSATTSGTAEKGTSKSGEMKAMIPESACYAGTNGKDSFFLKMEVFPNVVTGKLNYNFFEKDRNTGDIDGVLKGDTLVADYTFKSEGTTSTRQVAFLIKGDTVVEGYGPMDEKENKMIFTDKSKINFSGTPLKKIPCVDK
jgi:hypothetical protein